MIYNNMKTFTNEPTDNTFNEIVLNSTVTLTADSSGDTWQLVLPTNDGTSGQVFTTDGLGVTSWTTSTTGTVTSVAATVPTFLSISGSPITASGTLAIGLSGTALPVANGGTGSTNSTGTGSVVLATSPTITTATINLSTISTPSLTGNIVADQTIKVIKVADGDRLLLGNAESTNQSAIFRWVGTTNSNQNTLSLGVFGTSVNYEFRMDGQATFPTIALPGTTNDTIIKAAAATDAWTFTLPPNDGTAGQVLSTDGAGNTTWITP